MGGHVFHPGHDEWHGQTVVVFTGGSLTVVGRWDAVQEGTLLMRDAAVHDAEASEESREDWIARLAKYGIPNEHGTYTLPHTEVDRVTRLRDA